MDINHLVFRRLYYPLSTDYVIYLRFLSPPLLYTSHLLTSSLLTSSLPYSSLPYFLTSSLLHSSISHFYTSYSSLPHLVALQISRWRSKCNLLASQSSFYLNQELTSIAVSPVPLQQDFALWSQSLRYG